MSYCGSVGSSSGKLKSSSNLSALSMIDETFPPSAGHTSMRTASFSMVTGWSMFARVVLGGSQDAGGALEVVPRERDRGEVENLLRCPSRAGQTSGSFGIPQE